MQIGVKRDLAFLDWPDKSLEDPLRADPDRISDDNIDQGGNGESLKIHTGIFLCSL